MQVEVEPVLLPVQPPVPADHVEVAIAVDVAERHGRGEVVDDRHARGGVCGQALDELGVGFMFAPMHHSAMRHAIGPRKELGMRTIFNILGPMTNPAGVKRMLIGVYERALCRPVAEVLSRLGAEHVMVVHSDDGLEEISLAAPSHVAEAKSGQIREFEFRPEDAGINRSGLEGLEVTGVADSLNLIRAALSGAAGERAERARQVVALNAGAALYVAGLQESIRDGVQQSLSLLESGAPWWKIEALAAFTASL